QVVEEVGHEVTEDRVAEELEPLVVLARGPLRCLIRRGRVGERQRHQLASAERHRLSHPERRELRDERVERVAHGPYRSGTVSTTFESAVTSGSASPGASSTLARPRRKSVNFATLPCSG